MDWFLYDNSLRHERVNKSEFASENIVHVFENYELPNAENQFET